MMTTDEMIEVIRAKARGEAIQIRNNISGLWHDCGLLNPCFNFDGFDYRIKPPERKAREFWINTRTFEAERYAPHGRANKWDDFIHVREVLPE